MLIRARRPVACLCIALLALNQAACTHIRQEDPQTVIQPGGKGVPMERIVGVTLKDGRDIQFDINSLPVVRGDSLKAEVGNQPLTIAVSDVQRVWVVSANRTGTDLLVFGALVVALAVVATIAAFHEWGKVP